MPIQKVTKEEIIDKATAVFHKQGYHKTSVGDIAETCGILKGSLYHYFSGKEDIMKAVLEKFHTDFKEGAEKYALKDKYSPEEKLKRLIDYSEKVYTQTKFGSLMGNIVLETMNVMPDFVEHIKAFFNDWLTLIKDVLGEWYDEDAAEKIAKDAIASIEGAVMMMSIFKDKTYLKRVHERLRRMAEADIKAMTINNIK